MSSNDFVWISDPPIGNWEWVKRLFNEEFVRYYNEFISSTNEIPFGYAERSIVGQVAIAANKCKKFYTIQDYDTGIKIKKSKKMMRPDLWLYIPEKDDSYLIEFKKINRSIDFKQKSDLKKTINDKISEGFRECEKDNYNKLCDAERVKYQGAFVAIKFNCTKEKWGKYKGNPKSYNNQHEIMIEFTENKYWNKLSNKPNFSFYYLISHDKLIPDNEDSFWDGHDSLPVALLLFGSFREVKKVKA